MAVNWSVSELPGGIPAPVPTVNEETVQVTPEEVKLGVPMRKPPAVAPVMVHPDGALIVTAVTVY